MAEWWETLMTIEKVLYCIAVPSTIVFVMQALFIIFGSHGHDMDVSDTSGIDFDYDISDIHGMDFGHDITDIHGIGLEHDILGMYGAGGGHCISGVHNVDLNHGEFDYSRISGDDVSTHHDAGDNLDTFRLFTIQGIVGFFCMFSWASIAGISNGMNSWIAVLIGLILGIILMIMVALIIKYSHRLAQDGTFDIRDTLGANATVYLTVPEKKSGQGKVNVFVSERMVELNAITDSDKSIATGESVRIIDVINDVVVVEKEA